MSPLKLKNGVAHDRQRIEQEIDIQREKLTAAHAHFEAWRSRWAERQSAIDRSLAQLQDRLAAVDAKTPIAIHSGD